MKQAIIFFVACLLSVVVSSYCSPSVHMYEKQGVRGYVHVLKGNQMPSPGMPKRKPRGVSATLYIYSLVSMSQVEPDQKPSFYKAVHAPLIKTVRSDSTGYFEASLDTGGYSVFIRIGDLYYASLTDQYNHLAPIRVEAAKQTYVELTYADRATY